MPATTLAAVAAFKVVLFRKASIALGGQVIIALFNRDSFGIIGHVAKLLKTK